MPFLIRARLASHKRRAAGGSFFRDSELQENQSKAIVDESGRAVSSPCRAPTTSVGTKCAWALQTGVKDAITPSPGIPNTSENYLIFETSKHAGAVYWKAVLQSTPKAICHGEIFFFPLSTGRGAQ